MDVEGRGVNYSQSWCLLCDSADLDATAVLLSSITVLCWLSVTLLLNDEAFITVVCLFVCFYHSLSLFFCNGDCFRYRVKFKYIPLSLIQENGRKLPNSTIQFRAQLRTPVTTQFRAQVRTTVVALKLWRVKLLCTVQAKENTEELSEPTCAAFVLQDIAIPARNRPVSADILICFKWCFCTLFCSFASSREHHTKASREPTVRLFCGKATFCSTWLLFHATWTFAPRVCSLAIGIPHYVPKVMTSSIFTLPTRIPPPRHFVWTCGAWASPYAEKDESNR